MHIIINFLELFQIFKLNCPKVREVGETLREDFLIEPHRWGCAIFYLCFLCLDGGEIFIFEFENCIVFDSKCAPFLSPCFNSLGQIDKNT